MLKDKDDAILKAIQPYADGLSIEEITRNLSLPLARRTLQRRLADLNKRGYLQKTGAGKSTRYGIAIKPPTVIEENDTIKLSTESRHIKHYLQQPLKNRSAVEYNRRFLDKYHPNKTTYLSTHICKHLGKIGTFVPSDNPAGTYAKKILHHLLIDLSWNSSRLEGNTYSLLETEQLFARGEPAANKSRFETQMILNHKNAIEFLVDATTEITFNRFSILNLHALLSDNLLGNSEAYGQLRRIPVSIHGTVFKPLAIPQLIEECFTQILETAMKITNPFEQAFFVMIQLPYLQPFEDVNKRVSRLAANIPFIKYNLCPLSFVDVNEKIYIDSLLGVYELNRIELMRDLFVWAYEHSARRYATVRNVLSEPDSFKLNYRLQLADIISQIVKKRLNKKTAVPFIQQWMIQHIIEIDRARFMEIVETELLGLHAGNIARYRIQLADFTAWHKHF